MKVLLINGSPKGKKSNSLTLASCFVAGYVEELGKNEEEVDVEEFHLSTMSIATCRGCFACWKATPGMCCIHDDMASVIESLRGADLVVWSFPLHFFNLPGALKNMVDRLLPMFLPFMTDRSDGYGSGSHDLRSKRHGRRHVLVSTCGFWSAAGNYDAVTASFDHLLGRGNFESIFCGQGELLGVDHPPKRACEYLATAKLAGAEYARGKISESTRSNLGHPLYSKDEYEAMADASWDVDPETGDKETTDLMLAEQMAACFKKRAYDGEERVVEIHFTDLGTSYQILLGQDGGEVFADGSLKTSTWIHTPFDVWAQIAKGELDALRALDGHMYTVDGDFSLVSRWNKYFDAPLGRLTSESVSDQLGGKLAPSMTTMLIPWVTFWVVVSANTVLGAIVSIAVSLLMPVVMRRHKIVLWDWLSIAAVCVLSVVAVLVGDGDTVSIVGYLVFGLMWLGSCLTREPLCAAYVKYNYGGDAALDILLFTRTNVILAMAWGVLYVLTAGWTWLAKLAGFSDIVVIVNCIIPAAMGFFTEWFEGWYPAYLARGGLRSSANGQS